MKDEINYQMVNRLTRELKDARKRPAKEYEIWDTKLDGFVLRVQPSGRMTYGIVYARGKRFTIGPADTIDPAQARARALEVRAAHDKAKRGDGLDPLEEKEQKTGGAKSGTTYLRFLNDTYKPWLEINLVHGLYAYTTLVKAFPELHELKLAEITPGVIETWRTRKLQEDFDPNTINRQLSDLKACLHRARDIWDVAISDKLDRVKPCKIDRSPKVRYLTAAEETRLRQALDKREDDLRSGRLVYTVPTDLTGHTFADHLKPAILLSLHTGLRRGELLKLKWEDVHFDRASLTVVGTTSKTGKTRHVPLNAEALSTLKAWKEQPGLKSQFVFTGKTDDKGAHPMQDIGKSWEHLLKRARITGFRWHDLRHTFASKLVMAGENLNTVRELLGHADYKMTLRYAHLAPEHKAAAVAKLCAPVVAAT